MDIVAAQPSPTHTATPTPPAPHAAASTLSKAQIAAQRKTCLAQGSPQETAGTWRTAYAQRLGVLLSNHATRSVLILESSRAYLTCVDGDQVGWARRGAAAKIVPRTPGPSTPAVITDGVFNGVTTYDVDDGRKLVTFAARVTPTVVGGHVAISTPGGDGPWMTVPARQGWLVMQVAVTPSPGTRVLFSAVDSADQPVTLADTDGQPISTLSIPVAD